MYVVLRYSQCLLYEVINLSVLLGRLVRVHLIKPVLFLFCLSGILCGWRLSSKTWDPITSSWMKQLTWLRIVHSGDDVYVWHYALLVVYASNEEDNI